MEIIDLSVPVTAPPFRDNAGYGDPAAVATPWVAYGENKEGGTSPFSVSLLQLSAHAGSHIDAPSHFVPGGPSISGLGTNALAGQAAVVDLRRGADDQSDVFLSCRAKCSRAGTMPLVLTSDAGLPDLGVDELIEWKRPLVAIAGAIDGGSDYTATRRLLASGLWLASNLDIEQAARVRDGDLLVVAPLAWPGLEGAPCRVLAIRL